MRGDLARKKKKVNSSTARPLDGPHIHSHFVSLTHTHTALGCVCPDHLVKTFPGTEKLSDVDEDSSRWVRGHAESQGWKFKNTAKVQRAKGWGFNFCSNHPLVHEFIGKCKAFVKCLGYCDNARKARWTHGAGGIFGLFGVLGWFKIRCFISECKMGLPFT